MPCHLTSFVGPYGTPASVHAVCDTVPIPLRNLHKTRRLDSFMHNIRGVLPTRFTLLRRLGSVRNFSAYSEPPRNRGQAYLQSTWSRLRSLPLFYILSVMFLPSPNGSDHGRLHLFEYYVCIRSIPLTRLLHMNKYISRLSISVTFTTRFETRSGLRIFMNS